MRKIAEAMISFTSVWKVVSISAGVVVVSAFLFLYGVAERSVFAFMVFLLLLLCVSVVIIAAAANIKKLNDFAKTIYDGDYGLLPPPNSPWAAITGDFGLELMGHMSRIAGLPKDGENIRHPYLFRFYIHDIWWVNSPWYDRYNSQPHDIYLPLSVARLDSL